jgi:hypothetical protein
MQYSFSGAMKEISTYIQVELDSDAVDSLKYRSKFVVEKLAELYRNFFYTLAESGIKSGTDSDEGGLPQLYEGLAGVYPWKPVSPQWFNVKMKAAAIDSYMFYRGISEGITRKGITRKSSKRGVNRNLSLHQYVSGLDQKKGSVDRFFGQPKIAYELIRPDGKKVEISQNLSPGSRGGSIYQVMTHGDKGRFVSGNIDGTILRSQIWLFPNLEGLLPETMENGTVLSLNIEDRVTRYLGAKDPNHLMQWQKIFGVRKTGAAKTGPNKGEQKKAGQWKLRPLVTPLIQWYSEIGMARVMQKLEYIEDYK